MINFVKESYTVSDLVNIVAHLRSKEGCPWDQVQTHKSIRRNFLEEAYEVAEAIDEDDTEHLREELGDVLLQVVFHACIEQETGGFDLDGVADGVCKKLINRHPHIFSDLPVSGVDEVLKNWEEIKREEKKQTTTYAAMETVAKSLPALWRAEKLQEKEAKTGFDFPDYSASLSKIEEELDETRQAIAQNGDIAGELGDLLFSVVNLARFLKIDPEAALGRTCDKFVTRFRYMETEAACRGNEFSSMPLSEKDKLWNKGKQEL